MALEDRLVRLAEPSQEPGGPLDVGQDEGDEAARQRRCGKRAIGEHLGLSILSGLVVKLHGPQEARTLHGGGHYGSDLHPATANSPARALHGPTVADVDGFAAGVDSADRARDARWITHTLVLVHVIGGTPNHLGDEPTSLVSPGRTTREDGR